MTKDQFISGAIFSCSDVPGEYYFLSDDTSHIQPSASGWLYRVFGTRSESVGRVRILEETDEILFSLNGALTIPSGQYVRISLKEFTAIL